MYEVCESDRSRAYMCFADENEAVKVAKQLGHDATVYESDEAYWAAMFARGWS